MTLTELMVAIALIGVLSGIAVSQLPRTNRAPDQEHLPQRIATSLQAAHTQAVGQETDVVVTASGNQLTYSAGGESETETFGQARLSGALNIAASGESTGSVTVQADGVPCQRLSLDATGNAQPQQGGC